MKETNPKQIGRYFLILLAAGSAGLFLPGILNLRWGEGLASAIWIFAFIELTCRFRDRRHTLISLAVFCISYCIRFHGAAGILWLYLLVSVPTGLVLFGTFFLYSRIITSWNRPVATLAFPVLWMAIYLLGTLIRLPVFTRVDVMFTDMNVLLQSERLIGSFGLSFAVLWIIALIQYAAMNRRAGTAVLGAALYFLLLLYGIVCLFPNTSGENSVRVAYTTGPYVGDYLNYTVLPFEDCLSSMKTSVREAGEQSADILTFCEEAFEIKDYEENAFLEQCCDAAKENGIHILVGLDVNDTDGSAGGKGENKIIWINSDGEILGEYLKNRLIPVIESDYIPGDGNIPSHIITIGGRQIKVSYLICYDSNFPGYVRTIDDGTDILFLPSWDWDAVKILHSRLCCALAAENHVNIVKSTYDGLSIVINPDGRIIRSTDTAETGYEQVQIAEIPICGSREPEKVLLRSPVYGIIAVEIMSILLCIVLLYGNLSGHRGRTIRNRLFTALVSVCILGLSADLLSWILDGCTRLLPVLYISTTLSMILTFVMASLFVGYLTEFIKERRQISSGFMLVFIAFSAVAVILSIIGSINGELFIFENAVYSDGPMYWLYVLVNACTMIFCLIVVLVYGKAINTQERIATLIYIFIPGLSAAINLIYPEFSYAYPSTALSFTVIYVLLQSERVIRLEKEEQASSERAVHDDLTGLGNRRAFEEKIQPLPESDTDAGVIYADINELKYTNDTFGHEAGDRLLITFAELLCMHFRKDEIFRISGDEFAVVLPGIGKKDFEQRVTIFRNALDIHGKKIASIGTAFGSTKDINRLYKSAEAAMYREKKAFHERRPDESL